MVLPRKKKNIIHFIHLFNLQRAVLNIKKTLKTEAVFSHCTTVKHMDPELKRCQPHCDQQLHTSQRDGSSSAVSRCFNGPFTAQALSTKLLVLSRLGL